MKYLLVFCPNISRLKSCDSQINICYWLGGKLSIISALDTCVVPIFIISAKGSWPVVCGIFVIIAKYNTIPAEFPVEIYFLTVICLDIHHFSKTWTASAPSLMNISKQCQISLTLVCCIFVTKAPLFYLTPMHILQNAQCILWNLCNLAIIFKNINNTLQFGFFRSQILLRQ